MAKPDPELLVNVVADKVLDAWRIAAEALGRAGIRLHAAAIPSATTCWR
jgi:hypothetical protein